MTRITTAHGTFSLAEAAYGAGVKLGSCSATLEMERITREGVYRYFTDHPDELVRLIDSGFLQVADISDPVHVTG
jgi:hypothetical protein